MRKEHVLELNFLMCNKKTFTKNLESIKNTKRCVQSTFPFRFLIHFLSVCLFKNLLYLHHRSHDLCFEVYVHKQESIKNVHLHTRNFFRRQSSAFRVIFFRMFAFFIEMLNVAVGNEA